MTDPKAQPPQMLKANAGEGLELVRHMERTLQLPKHWQSFTVRVTARGAIEVSVDYLAVKDPAP
jgi:hypothetical protein